MKNLFKNPPFVGLINCKKRNYENNYTTQQQNIYYRFIATD